MNLQTFLLLSLCLNSVLLSAALGFVVTTSRRIYTYTGWKLVSAYMTLALPGLLLSGLCWFALPVNAADLSTIITCILNCGAIGISTSTLIATYQRLRD